jgi:hypothetical protein
MLDVTLVPVPFQIVQALREAERLLIRLSTLIVYSDRQRVLGPLRGDSDIH